MQGIFITGTNTDVGKTFIAVAIARALTARNITVIPRKPIESGCIRQNDELIPQDASALKQAATQARRSMQEFLLGETLLISS